MSLRTHILAIFVAFIFTVGTAQAQGQGTPCENDGDCGPGLSCEIGVCAPDGGANNNNNGGGGLPLGAFGCNSVNLPCAADLICDTCTRCMRAGEGVVAQVKTCANEIECNVHADCVDNIDMDDQLCLVRGNQNCPTAPPRQNQPETVRLLEPLWPWGDPLAGRYAYNVHPILPGWLTFTSYFMRSFMWILDVAVGIVVVWVLGGGFMFMTSGNNQTQRTDAISRIKWSIAGLLLLLFTSFIMRTLNNIFFY